MRRTGSHSRRSGGFTIVELLVVVAIAAVVMSAVFVVQRLVVGGGAEAATNTVAQAVNMARTVALIRNPFPDGGRYQGAALLFTPAGEVRVLKHSADVTASGAAKDLLWDRNLPRLGYRDAPDLLLRLPTSVGVVGIVRQNETAGNPPRLLTPPFAIRFDENGQLAVYRSTAQGSVTDGYVYYEARRPGTGITPPTAVMNAKNANQAGVQMTAVRAVDYNVYEWDPRNNRFVGFFKPGPNDMNPPSRRYELPFDRIEAVTGIIVYVKSDLDRVASSLGGNVAANRTPETVLTGSGPNGSLPVGGNTVGDWLYRNGTILFFNRYNGSVMRVTREAP